MRRRGNAFANYPKRSWPGPGAFRGASRWKRHREELSDGYCAPVRVNESLTLDFAVPCAASCDDDNDCDDELRGDHDHATTGAVTDNLRHGGGGRCSRPAPTEPRHASQADRLLKAAPR